MIVTASPLPFPASMRSSRIFFSLRFINRYVGIDEAFLFFCERLACHDLPSTFVKIAEMASPCPVFSPRDKSPVGIF